MKTEVASIDTSQPSNPGRDHSFPASINLEKMVVLIVEGESASLEKIEEVLQNAAVAKVKVVAGQFSNEIKAFAQKHVTITLIQRAFKAEDVKEADIVIVAVDNTRKKHEIQQASKKQGKLVYVAGEPALSDFHLGHVVKKGNLKIAISTPGDSSAIADKIKEQINILVPTETTDDVDHSLVLLNNNVIADQEKNSKLQGQLGAVDEVKSSIRWKKLATYSIGAFALMLIGHIIFSTPPIVAISNYTIRFYQTLEPNFYWMVLAGFFAQLVDGALGMGYGVTSSSIMLSTGINPTAISGSIHAAEMFASGASGYSHYKFGNVNKKLFKVLLIPGIIGAVSGAVLLVWLGSAKADYVRPALAIYTLFMGVKIIFNALKKEAAQKKFKQYGWLAGLGGFLDSFGGGGWGPIVTTTLITKGRSPRFVIGTVSLTEFFVTLSSAFTFFTLIGVSHWQVIAALVIGGLIGAPIAAKLAGKLLRKTSMVLLGVLVIFWSFRILVKVF